MSGDRDDGGPAQDAQHVANLVMLVGRLVQQVRKREPANDVADKAMDYLRRKDLFPSIVRGVNGARKDTPHV